MRVVEGGAVGGGGSYDANVLCLFRLVKCLCCSLISLGKTTRISMKDASIWTKKFSNWFLRPTRLMQFSINIKH